MKWTMMRHGNKVKHLGMPADQRKALIRGLVTELIRHGAIKTTKVSSQLQAPAAGPEEHRETADVLDQQQQQCVQVYTSNAPQLRLGAAHPWVTAAATRKGSPSVGMAAAARGTGLLSMASSSSSTRVMWVVLSAQQSTPTLVTAMPSP
jgi:hypothetical protein